VKESIQFFRDYINECIHDLRESGPASRNACLAAADRIREKRHEQEIPGLWEHPPLMLTATIDDGWGHGLEVIHRFAKAAGLECIPLGLLLNPEKIIEECRSHRPDLLGLTVLQFDSEEALKRVRKEVPNRTRIVAGGPLFRADPDFAQRTGMDAAVRDAAGFLEFLLETEL
jgi:methylmalonyl-CoA mutase cobalamin-binding subunit